ncbi:MAG: cation:proton antiporter [Holosporales bacterium]|jgi:CPA2 family monovalent cation:H+ antiporter-2|nr:cation:proton antiporter [Holosporales bacterium]
MDTASPIPLELVVFLATAVLVSVIASRHLISSVFGYLCAGILLGPFALNLLKEGPMTHAAAEFGVVFLLFTVGLHLPFSNLHVLKKYIFGMGFLQVFLTTILYGPFAPVLGFRTSEAFIVGFIVALSSTAISFQILEDKGDLGTRHGRASFAILIFQDLAAVVALAVVPFLDPDTSGSWWDLGATFLKIVSILGAIFAFARSGVKRVFHWAALGGAELFMAVTLLTIFGIAALTHFAGLSVELGAFLAGIMLANSEYQHQMMADIRPTKGILVGLYFLTVGASVDLNVLYTETSSILGLLGSILIVKSAVLIMIGRIFGFRWSSSIQVAGLLATGGEFAFVLFVPVIAHGFVDVAFQQKLFLAIALSMAITPILAALAKYIAERFERPKLIQELKNKKAALEEENETSNHVIIVGFGRSGRVIGALLSDNLIPYVAIDRRMNRIAEARAKGLPAFYGDARSKELYRDLGIEEAQFVVITLGSDTSVTRVASMIRRNFPNTRIFLQSYIPDTIDLLRGIGAHVVVPETLEPGLQLASVVLENANVTQNAIDQSLARYRKKKAGETKPLPSSYT